jgi:single-stranded-DNA-specific exonuclease
MSVQRIWQPVPCDDAQADVVARELGISPITARLLCIRGLGELDRARRFLSPSLDDLHDPFQLADMAPAVERILGAIARQERIAIHGDYDVDGVTSTVILRRALELLGADVVHFIPERLRDGYGLQTPALDRLHADGVRLVISVDCGIRAADAARHATSLGLDLIITDHHAAGLRVSRQEPRGRGRRAEAGAGAVPEVGQVRLVAGVRQDRCDRDARRRRSARG